MPTKVAKLASIVGALMMSGAAIRVSFAQDTFQGASMSSQTADTLGVAAGPQDDHAIPVAGWLLYPSFYFGYVFNDNIYGRPNNRVAASGIRVRPALEAVRDSGLHRTMLYFDADFQVYPGLGGSERYVALQRVIDAPPTNVSGRAGLQHIWKPLEDLTVQVSIDATRQSGLFAPYTASAVGHSNLPNSFSFSSIQQYVNQLAGSLAVEKQIGERGFVRSTSTAFFTSYDNRPILASPSALNNFLNGSAVGGNFQNGWGFRQALRGGLYVTPQIYAFVEPGLDLRRYNNSIFDTNGYRILAGLGSDMISLFRGEIYGGYQSQSSASGLFGRATAPSFGARLFYYPTRDLTLSLSVDQTLTSTSAPMLVNSVMGPFWQLGGQRPAAAARTRQILAQAEYTPSPNWGAYLRGGYGETTFSNSGSWGVLPGFGGGGFSTDGWSAGAGINYQIWRNISVSVDYQFLKTRLRAPQVINQTLALSGGLGQGFSRNMVSVGLNWRF